MPSPIAVLAYIHPISGHSKALDSLLCLRPSELWFLLHLLDIGSITTTSFLSNTRQLTMAITTLHNSEIMSRLSKFATLNTNNSSSHGSIYMQNNAIKGSYVPNTLDREVVITIDMQAPLCIASGEKVIMNLLHDEGPGKALLADQEATTALTTSLLASTVEDSREAGSNVLSSIVWLINVAKSTLKRVYEDATVVARGEAMVRELSQLRDSILAKQELIRKSILDWERLVSCKDLCQGYKSLLGLLLEMYKGRKKAELWKPGTLGISIVDDGFQRPVLLSTIKEVLGDGDSYAKHMGWSEQDAEHEKIFGEILMSTFAVEKTLRDPSTPANVMVSLPLPPAALKGASTRQSLAMSANGGAGRVGVEEESFAPPTPRVAVAPQGSNPLWVIMQNVFRNPNP